MAGGLLTQFGLLFLLLGMNGFFASSEIAIISLNETRIRKKAKEGEKTAQLLLSLINEPSKFLATIQVGVTLSGLLASALASESFSDLLAGLAVRSGLPITNQTAKILSVAIITLFISYFTLVFGELIPKRLALQNPDRLSRLAVKPLVFVSRIAAPFIKLLTFSTNFFIRLFGGNPVMQEQRVTEEEIRMLVDLGEEKGVIPESEREMIRNVFDFDSKTVEEIMTHRKDIIGIPVTAGFEEVIEVIEHEKYSRFPVYEGTMDNIVGILTVKDLMVTFRNTEEPFVLATFLRQPLFVPTVMKIDRLFGEMQKKKTHLAVVIDEYGGTAGIISLEDMVEEIVGNIWDEHDETVKYIDQVDETTYLINGSAELEEVERALRLDLQSGNYETISGFIIGQLGRIPRDEELATVEYAGVTFTVEKVKHHRIHKIKAKRQTKLNNSQN